MNRFNKTLFFLAFSAFAFGAQTSFSDAIYVQLQGSNAVGTVGARPFAGASWRIEFALEASTPDFSGSASTGGFYDSILGASLQIEAEVFGLAEGTTDGDFSTYSGVDGDRVSLSLYNGGSVQFATAPGTIFPSIFSSHRNLETANFGSSVSNSTTDLLGTSSYLVVLRDGFIQPGLTTSDGQFISIEANSVLGAGDLTFSVSQQSVFAPSTVPEPGSCLICGLAAAGFGYRRRV